MFSGPPVVYLRNVVSLSKSIYFYPIFTMKLNKYLKIITTNETNVTNYGLTSYETNY